MKGQLLSDVRTGWWVARARSSAVDTLVRNTNWDNIPFIWMLTSLHGHIPTNLTKRPSSTTVRETYLFSYTLRSLFNYISYRGLVPLLSTDLSHQTQCPFQQNSPNSLIKMLGLRKTQYGLLTCSKTNKSLKD